MNMKTYILVMLAIFILSSSCRINRYKRWHEETVRYYIVDSVCVTDTFWIEAVHTYSKKGIKTQFKQIKLN